MYLGLFSDPNYSIYYWMPSNAIDANENVGYTFSEGNVTGYPSPYMVTIDSSGNASTPKQVLAATGADASDNIWGEYVSVSSDPDATDNISFWATGEYFTATQQQCPAWNPDGSTKCTWQTQLFNCQVGNNNGFCP